MPHRNVTNRKSYVGRILLSQWVCGGIFIQTKGVFKVVVQNLSGTTLLPVINKCIISGSTIYSDEYRAYRDIEQLWIQ